MSNKEQIHLLSARKLRELFCKGELSAIEIVEHFLKRIHIHNPSVGAFLSIFDEKAKKRAKELDDKRLRGEKLGKLAAVPIAIKDNIHLKGELTTCASKFLSNYKALFDATATRLLEEEDAIFIGKTNMDEFAMGSSTENSALQKTKNPWDLNCVPGGSSGGSAAAVAARLVPIALGSDTGGSVRQPASFCGVVGFKPTYGRVSRYGLVAYGSSLDQIGPLSVYTEDSALVMEIIGRHCKRDSTSINKEAEEYFQNLSLGIHNMKIGVPWECIEQLQEPAKENFLSSIEQLKTLGAHIVDIRLNMLKYSIPVYYVLATAEASTNLARFDGVRYGVRSPNAQTLDQVYDLSKEEGFGPEVKRRILLGTYVLSSGYKDAFYKKAQKVRTLMIKEYKEQFQTCNLIAMPVTPSPAFKTGSIQDPLQMYLADIYTISANLAGLPAISVPSGLSPDGTPMGLQIIGPQMHDVQVCRAANAFEQSMQFSKLLPPITHN
ncbi:MAG: Asp-tRNA(Asn)/Glu-tRNA(Gln) amidotransferase subunit GatA [Chlamydiales bacterium]|nr:Asp-tRNA(Asn)/Glu-tRNA(Gln) amidotransferase subunit GatA [Chlamydiales bacterium]